MSTLCQTDEEVIPPKILMSISSQTDICIPTVVWPQQFGVVPLPAFSPQAQAVATANVQTTAPAQLQTPTYSTQASNVFQAAYNQSAQYYQSQQPYSFRPIQQGQLRGQVNPMANQVHTTLHSSNYPTTVSQPAGFSSAGYQCGAFSSTQVGTSQLSASSQYTHVPSTDPNRTATYISAFNDMIQRNSARYAPQSAGQLPQSHMMNQTLPSYPSTAQSNRPAGRQQHSTQQQTTPSLTLQQLADARANLQLRINVANRSQLQLATADIQASRVSDQSMGIIPSSGVAYQQGLSPHVSLGLQGMSQNQQGTSLNSSMNQPAVLGGSVQQPVAQSLAVCTQGNPVRVPQNQQGANLNSSVNQSAISGVRQSVSHPVAVNAQLHTQRMSVSQNQGRLSLNSSTNPSAVNGVTVQELVSQTVTVNTRLHNQGSASLVSQNQGQNLNSPVNQTVVSGVTVQQSVSQPMAVNTRLHTEQSAASVAQNHQGQNLYSTVNQTGVSGVTLQQLLSHSTTVNMRLHNQRSAASVSQNRQGWNLNSPLNQTGAGGVTSPQTQQRAQSGLSLCDEVRLVYNQLQKSLDEVTVNKQKQRNVSVANAGSERDVNVPADVSVLNVLLNNGGSEMRTRNMATSNQSETKGSTDTSSSTSVSSKGPPSNQTCDAAKTDSNRSSPSASFHTAAGSLEQNSVTEQMTYLSSNKKSHKRPPKTPSGALEDAVQRLLALQNNNSSSQRDFSCTAHSSVGELFDGASTDENLMESLTSGPETSDDSNVSQPEKQSQNESLQDCIPESRTLQAVSLGQNDGRSHQRHENQHNPPECISDLPVGIDVDVMKSVANATSSEEKDTGDSSMAEEDEEAVNADGDTEENMDNNPESVFIAPSTPTKTKGVNNKDTSNDDLYVDLMSPVIPQITTARHVWPRIPRLHLHDENCDDSDVDSAVQNSDQGIANDPKPTSQIVCETEGTVDSEEAVRDEQYANKNLETNAEPTLNAVETQQAVTNVDIVDSNVGKDPECALNVIETKEFLEVGDNADRDIQTNAKSTPSTAEGRQTVTNMDIVDADAENDLECAASVVETKESVVGGDNADEDIETTAEQKQLKAEADQTFTTMDVVDHSAENDPECAFSVAESSTSVEDGGSAVEEMETDAAETQKAVTNEDIVDPDADEGPQSAVSVAETKVPLEDEENAHKDMETNAELTLSTAEEQQTVTDVDIVSLDAGNYREFTQSVVDTAESLEEKKDMDKDIETVAGPKHSVAERQQAGMNADNSDLDIESGSAPTVNIAEQEEAVSDAANTVTNTQSAPSITETEQTAVTQRESADYDQQDIRNSSKGNAQENAALPLLPETTMQDKEDLQATSTSGSFNSLSEIDQPECGMKSSTGHHMGEESGEEYSTPQAPIPSTRQKLESNHGPCMGDGKTLDNKRVNEKEHETFSLEPEAIPKRDLFYLNSAFEETPAVTEFRDASLKICDPDGMKNHPLGTRQDPVKSYTNPSSLSSLERRDVNALVASNTKVNQNEKENAATNESSHQLLNGVSIPPVPRLAVRLVKDDLVIMWDLPPDNKVTDIDYFELYSWSRSGHWLRIAQIKALRLPMGCTLKNVVPGKLFLFTVRAVGRNGSTGPCSQPSGITYS